MSSMIQQPQGLVQVDDTFSLRLDRKPQAVIDEASMAAKALMKAVKDNNWAQKFGNRDHLFFEAWGFLANMYRVVPRVRETRYVQFGDVQGYEAVAEAVHIPTQTIIGTAESMCLDDEDNWDLRAEYAKERDSDGKKVKIGDKPVPLFQLRSMAQCVPLRAQILTSAGFKYWNELRLGELVLAYDVKTDACRWTPLRAVSAFENQPTILLKSRSFKAICTDNHSWALRTAGGHRELRKASDLKAVRLGSMVPASEQAVIVAAPGPGGPSILTDQEAAILGWLLTDGTMRDIPSFDGWRIHIDQSKEPYVEELRELVATTGARESTTQSEPRTFPKGRTYATLPATRFSFPMKYSRALFEKAGIEKMGDFPRVACELSTSARKAMFEAMLKGDGHFRKGGNRSGMTRVFGQKDSDVLHTFRVLACLEGQALGTPYIETSDGYEGPFIRQVVRVNRVATVDHLQVTPADTEDVWCPTTDFGTWVMNLDGHVMITGNTRAMSRCLKGPFSWVIAMAGYAPTGVEDLTSPRQKQADSNAHAGGVKVNEKQAKRIWAIGFGGKMSSNDINAFIKAHGFDKADDITLDKYEEIVKALEEKIKQPQQAQTQSQGQQAGQQESLLGNSGTEALDPSPRRR
jgi:hypothetical protein